MPNRTVVRCVAPPMERGSQKGRVVISQRNPRTNARTGEVTTFDARIRTVWRNVGAMTYGVKLFDDNIDFGAGGSCADLSSEWQDLGEFEVGEEDGTILRLRPADFPSDLDLDVSESAGLIVALTNEDNDGEVLACCVLE